MFFLVGCSEQHVECTTFSQSCVASFYVYTFFLFADFWHLFGSMALEKVEGYDNVWNDFLNFVKMFCNEIIHVMNYMMETLIFFMLLFTK